MSNSALLHCNECVEPDEDPLPWCDCGLGGPDERCDGPCRKRAHDPDRCPTLATSPLPGAVRRFAGNWAALSNFSPHPVHFEGHWYPSGEHAYAAAKTLDPSGRETVRAASSPAEAKRLGRRLTLRPGWNESVRYTAMRTVLASKFQQQEPRDVLMRTGSMLLIEGNNWHDNTWGDCTCGRPACSATGMNLLGWMLMETRLTLGGVVPTRTAGGPQ